MSWFKIGGRVRHDVYGEGTIYGIYNSGNLKFMAVEFDEKHPNLHNGYNKSMKFPARGENRCDWFTDLNLYITPIFMYAYELMYKARKNPEKYEGKRYQFIDSDGIWALPGHKPIFFKEIEVSAGGYLCGIKSGEHTGMEVYVNGTDKLVEVNPKYTQEDTP